MVTLKALVFSSKEQIDTARKFKASLEENFTNVRCTIWIEGFFGASQPFLSSLNEIRTYDFTVAIFTPDDEIVSRKGSTRQEKRYVPRDNVVFEAGMSIGILGIDRTFLLQPSDIILEFPTDIDGHHRVQFDLERVKDGNSSAFGTTVMNLKPLIEKLDPNPRNVWAKRGLTEEDIGQFFYDTGLTHAYPDRIRAMDQILSDIKGASESVSMCARVYISEILKSPVLSPSIYYAAQKNQKACIVFTHTSTSPENEELVTSAYKREPSVAENIDQYRKHLGRSDVEFDSRFEELKQLKAKGASVVGSVKFVRRFLKSELPYSLIVIDEKIVFVSFYPIAGIGTYAPSMRLVSDDVGNDSWAKKFLDVNRQILETGSTFVKEYML